ncbi:MAG TPA: hypothetical protein VLE46_18215 [Nitrospira sp.]|nr:hypothetical protein [Nitrospira sp.]
MMKYFIVTTMSVVICSTGPVAVLAGGLAYQGVDYEVSDRLERNSSLYNVFTERFGMQPDTSYYGDTVRDQAGKESAKSDDSMLSKQGPQESDVGRFPDAAKGQPSLGFSGLSSADPSVQDLSRMDSGGFAPPGSYTGSMRRP